MSGIEIASLMFSEPTARYNTLRQNYTIDRSQVLCLVAILSVEAQKREKVELVPLSTRGDVCDKVCNKRDGWERCEKVQKRGQYEVTCTDLRGGKGGPGGPKGPFGGRGRR
ncbi:unnamed protein product [Cylicocyclus nassatus]|uniref:Uncharacterized protein n=1 Tax=Cylicocyclus nassatus TaxID=53992 RepID=A0AA36GZK2_CYLNA|nr:unnamed protein product [Cylicocyclus nassatus]